MIVITGCAHPGVVNIVKKAKELMKKDNVYLVMGGFHHPPIAVVKKFRELGVKKLHHLIAQVIHLERHFQKNIKKIL